jgi:hypothetical protein
MGTVTQVAEAMQYVLGDVAARLGRGSGFIEGQRKFSGSSIVQTLVFAWLAKRGSGQLVSDDAASRFSTSPICGFLGQPDEKSFGAADIAESIRVLILNHCTNELRAVFAEPGERLVEVVHSEHDA